MAMLEVKDLNVYYGMIQAIKGIKRDFLSRREGRGHCSDRCKWCRKDNYPADSDRNYSGKSRKHCF